MPIEPRIPTGNHELVETIRRMQKQIRSQRINAVTGAKRFTAGPDGYSIVLPDDAPSSSGGGVNLALFSIASIAPSTLSCHQITAGVASASLTTVNLPPTLQLGATYFAFETVSTVRYTTVMEIVPAYVAGQIIIAGEVDGTWYDLNYDGRQYLEQRQTVQVCVNNVTKLMRIRGSLPHS